MSPKKPRPINDGQHDSDTKVLLAQGLAFQKAELQAAITLIEALYAIGATSLGVIHDGENLPVHFTGSANT